MNSLQLKKAIPKLALPFKTTCIHIKNNYILTVRVLPLQSVITNTLN